MTMTSNRRFVLDSNLIVSAALFPTSIAYRAHEKALAEGHLLISTPVVNELEDVLSRKKFDRWLALDTRLEFLESLVKQATLVPITETIVVCRDPKDDKILELAISGTATCIISGDKDLTILSPFRTIPIYTPVEFLEKTWEDED